MLFICYPLLWILKKMLRVYHLLIGAVLLVLIPLGARFILPRFFATKETQSNPVATMTKSPSPSKTANVVEGNIWKKILGNTTAPENWQITPCEGNAPLLCISSKKEPLGTVEIGVYPVKNNPDFQKKLTVAGIPLGSKINDKSPEYQNQVLKALQAWVADFDSTFAKDRQASYGNKVVLSAYPPQQVSIGKLQGLRYGFVGLKPEGGVQEQFIGHVAYDGTAIYVITTGFASGSVTGNFQKLENLAIFQPYLYAIVANLNLSASEESPKSK